MTERAMLIQKEAAAYVGMSVPTFRKKVRPYVKQVYLDRLVRIPVSELDRWVAERAEGV